jgi:Xaa-Pro aminopeptidase
MPTSRKMHPGDMVYIDISTMYKGYCNDAGLSTCVGKPPTKEKETILETAVLMNEAITNVTKPGVQCNALVEVAREVARENGFPGPYGDFYDVTAGHGMGICQKEMPQINTQCTDKLLPNMYFAIESMIGKVGVGCGCCESSLAVTETGSERYMLFDRRPWLKK